MNQYSKNLRENPRSYETIGSQLNEVQAMIQGNDTLDREKLLEKVKKVINNFYDLDRVLSEEKLQFKEMEVILKAEIETLNTKLKMKELECQQVIEEYKIKLEKAQALTKERFMEAKNRILECKSIERNKEKLELLAYRLNYFIQNDIFAKFSEKSETETDQELISKIADKFQKELSQFTLSQREKLAFNYIHQSAAQENLGDVCLDDLLKITSNEIKVKSENDKLRRIHNCKSAGELGKCSEFYESEQSSTEEIYIDSHSSIDESISEIKVMDENKLKPLLEKNIKKVKEVKLEDVKDEVKGVKLKKPKEDILVKEEKPYEDQKVDLKQRFIRQRIKKPIIYSPANYLLKLNTNSNIASRNPNKSVIVQSHQQDRAKVNTRNDNDLQKDVKSNGQCKSLQKLLPKDWNYQNEGRSVIISKNYGNQHNEVNVNISIMDNIKQHIPELIVPKGQLVLKQMPSRSGSAKTNPFEGKRFRKALNVISMGKKFAPQSYKQRVGLKVNQHIMPNISYQQSCKAGVSVPSYSPINRIFKKEVLGERRLHIPDTVVQSENPLKNIKATKGNKIL